MYQHCLWRPTELRKYTDCIHQCGNITIPYPFGIGPNHCSYNPFFDVSCNSSSSLHIPFLRKLDLEILEVRKTSKTIVVKMPSVTTCNSTEVHWSSPSLPYPESHFFIGDQNVFASVGCHGYAFFKLGFDQRKGFDKTEGCTSVCAPPNHHHDLNLTSSAEMMDRCYGFNNCCQIDFDTSFIVTYNICVSVRSISGHCRSAFLISREYLATVATSVAPTSAVPVMLQWYMSNTYLEHEFRLRTFYRYVRARSSSGSRASRRDYFWCCKTKRRRKEAKLRKKYFKRRLEEQRLNQEEAEKTKLFTEKELNKATDSFSENRIIGKGRQGTVYKRMLGDGKLIAVKRSSSLCEIHWKEFINEVIIHSYVNHRNVVKLLGCCLETKALLLVYEFIPNGTLSEPIHSPNEEFRLTWEIRLRITSEVAGAIAYLHSDRIWAHAEV